MLRVRRLGRIPYGEGHDLQKSLARFGTDDYALLLEHPHVYSFGVRADPAHVLVDPGTIGAELVQSDRGGDVTYHGPGQLILYPIVTVSDDPGAGPDHVHRLEQIVIDVVSARAKSANVELWVGRLEEYPGVWVKCDESRPKKIASIGIRTDRVAPTGGELRGQRRTRHGVALNVDCDLGFFDGIVPCGIEGCEMTSMDELNLLKGVTMEDIAEAIVERVVEVWGGTGWDGQSVTLPQRSPGAKAEVEAEREADTGPRHLPGHDVGTQPDSGTEGHMLRRLRQAGTDPDAGIPIGTPKPSWLRAPVRMGDDYLRLGKTIHDLGLVTVCEEAGCPNVFECWADGTATFMVNGSRCTRACGFCKVDSRKPLPLDADEPARVAEAVVRMGLSHAVITCVARDDLADGGAGGLASVVQMIRTRSPTTRVELLISDCKGVASSQETIFESRPDVLNHNIETVARLQRAVRPQAGYARSLTVLGRASARDLVTKSGLMVGLGESREEVLSTMIDLRSVGVSILTIGQYLRPSRHHLPVARWWEPDEFDDLGALGREMGFAHVEASPLTRSSYHAKSAAVAASPGGSIKGQETNGGLSRSPVQIG